MPKRESRMKEYRVYLPEKIGKEIDKLVSEGIYPTPSEAIREVVRDWYKEVIGR